MSNSPPSMATRRSGRITPKPAQDVLPSQVPPAPAAAAAAAAAAEAPVTTDGAKSTKGRRIPRAVAQLFQDHFEKFNYGMNQKLPKHGTDTALDKIIAEHNLKRTQASNQLRKYRERKFRHGDVWLETDEADLRILFDAYDDKDDVAAFLEIIFDPDSMEKAEDHRDYVSFTDLRYIRSLSGVQSDMMGTLLFMTYDAAFVEVWAEVTRFYAAQAAEIFPNTARNIRARDLNFISRRQEEMKRVCRSKVWKNMRPSAVSSCTWAAVFAFVEECFFMSWAHRLSSAEDSTSFLSVPTTDMVSKYADSIVYYIASWLIAQLMVANRAGGVENKKSFMSLAEFHNLSFQSAAEQNLPTEVVDRRERKSLRRSSRPFYIFVRRIESWHVANLNLCMMVRHSSGDLLNAIQRDILSNQNILTEFEHLCKTSDGSYVAGLEESKRRKAALEYVITKFQRMRGREFERTIRGQSGKSRRAADSNATTRIGVAMQTGASKEGISREKDAESRLAVQYKKIKDGLVALPNDGIEDVDEEEECSSDDDK